ncbi:multiple monosaccharide ABC transporter permease [Naasia aerilata]|uniref:Xylose transport system permease protein XylH n=1 Tax=Naasia aerilata TaxID=1162966 RepID=A0ABN6XL83_9MICO|nr:multiple monosaccharide ABC transporter permease [Naasia aerilata]BDZ45715.1 sugar ABC transporter permease [Naasia aerilata]
MTNTELRPGGGPTGSEEIGPPQNKVTSAISHVLADLGKNGIFVALVLVVALFAVLTISARGDSILLRPQNISNLIVQNGYILILAIGMVLVIVAGHIDLSVGSVAAFIGAISGVFAVKMDLPWWIAIILSLAIGALVGAWQGFWIAYVGIPAFIVTLAGMLIFRGLALVVLGNSNIGSFPAEYRAIGNGFLEFLPIDLGPRSSIDLVTLGIGLIAIVALVVQQIRTRVGRQKYGQDVEPFGWFIAKLVLIAAAIAFFAYALSAAKGIPVTLIILAVLVLIYSTVANRSVFGRHIYAIGGNRHAAELSGIKTRSVDFWLFVNMGVLAALAGLVFTARLNLAGPKAGDGFELEAISAAFIGGAAVQGGVGTVSGAIIGGLIIGVLNNGMSIMGIGIEWQQAVKGLVLLLAVAFDVFNKRRSGGR